MPGKADANSQCGPLLSSDHFSFDHFLSLAREAARSISRQPGVVCIALTGSVAAGHAQEGSDIDLAVYWNRMPALAELEKICNRMGGREHGCSISKDASTDWASERYFVDGVLVDLSHVTVSRWEADMKAVLIDHMVPHSGQSLLHGLLEAVPLYGHKLHGQWQAKARAYPEGLARRMIAVHLPVAAYTTYFGDKRGGRIEKMTRSGDLLVRHELRLQSAYGLLAALAGLNRLYWPGPKHLDLVIERMSFAPPDLWRRLQSAFSASLGDGEPVVALELDVLWAEAWGLFEQHMPELMEELME